ncbi:MAG: DNA-formamidopyrimidine glycosylase family protein [Candidatus Limnocylindrales bacterium]
MPEGDTLARIAAGLRPFLAGRTVIAARARVPGPQVGLVVGATITEVLSMGKNLLIRLDNGLELRTHLRMNGTWHRYRPGERWRRAASRAVLVIEVPGAVAVCFDAPVVELLETRAEALHAPLAGLGPDLLNPAVDVAEARRRLRAPERAVLEVGPALLDQRALAGIGNVVKSETLFIERVDPFVHVRDLDDDTLDRLVATARRILVESARRTRRPERVTTIDPVTHRRLAPGALWVYGRAGRPCHRCRSLVRVVQQGLDLPRSTYWCPSCQPHRDPSHPPPDNASDRRNYTVPPAAPIARAAPAAPAPPSRRRRAHPESPL